jgi:hypothetical protein
MSYFLQLGQRAWDFLVWPQFLHLINLGKTSLMAARRLPFLLVLLRRFGKGVIPENFKAKE